MTEGAQCRPIKYAKVCWRGWGSGISNTIFGTIAFLQYIWTLIAVAIFFDHTSGVVAVTGSLVCPYLHCSAVLLWLLGVTREIVHVSLCLTMLLRNRFFQDRQSMIVSWFHKSVPALGYCFQNTNCYWQCSTSVIHTLVCKQIIAHREFMIAPSLKFDSPFLPMFPAWLVQCWGGASLLQCHSLSSPMEFSMLDIFCINVLHQPATICVVLFFTLEMLILNFLFLLFNGPSLWRPYHLPWATRAFFQASKSLLS